MDIAVQIALNVVIAGALYSLAALGFNLVYSTTRFFDLAYGVYATAGAYAVFRLYNEMDLPLSISLIGGVFIAGFLGFAVEKIVYKQLRKRGASATVLLITSLGVLTALQAVLAIMFSSQFQTLSRSFGEDKIIHVFGGVITEMQVIILLVSFLIMLTLGVMLRYTTFGKAVRAIADDEEVASIVGVNTGRVIGVVFLISSMIAGVAGIAVGFDTGIQPTIGLSLLLKGVIAAVIGGLGNVYAGVIGAFLLALLENAGAWQFAGEWKDAIAFLVLIIFLLFRPQGLFTR